MACVLRNPLICTMKKIVQTSVKPVIGQSLRIGMPLSSSTRGLSRSYYCLGSSVNTIKPASITHKVTSITKPCGCCGLHTEGDGEFSKFLDKEIDFEIQSNKQNKESHKLNDWQVQTDEAEVTLTRSADNEVITVNFNISNSVNPDEDLELEPGKEGEEDSTKMVSKPIFTVELKKGSGSTLRFLCSFPPPEESYEEYEKQQEEKEEFEDQFEIDEVSVYKGEVNDSSFNMSAAVMDGVMYDKLMDLLDERGITDEFITEMVKFSTDHEHGQYIKFLQDLKSFVQEK